MSVKHPSPLPANRQDKTHPRLTDREAQFQNRERAKKAGAATHLHRIARDEIEDRLKEINRTFTRIAIITPFPDVWAESFPKAHFVADQDVLDLPADLDLVIHALCLHWSADPVGQMVQCARALRPDGLFLAAMLGGQTLFELRDVLTRAEVAVTGGLSPRVLPLGEIRDLGGLLDRAGLALPVADHLPLRVSYRDLFHLAHDLRAMAEQNALDQRPRTATRRDIFIRAAADYAERYPDPSDSGRVLATFDIIFLTGWAAAPDQPKPLRPGSARHSLAEALNPRKQ